MSKSTRYDDLIRYAKSVGYKAFEDGSIQSPLGTLLTGGTTASGHKSFTVGHGIEPKDRRTVLWHRFVAYYFLGDEALQAECIRHLNGIPGDNRLDNLKPGTMKENTQDMGPEARSARSKVNAPALIARSRKLSDEDIKDMRELRKTLKTPYHKLAKQFNVTTMTAHRCCSGECWSSVNV